ncbi:MULTISPECIES: HIRAN domain-containing protein [unclassified Fusibacter]|uniref:HIRAN domain-containing protein n=1 Tax=unclassified Fusibacter TaxID=2624464 RepID=UPI001012FE7B|nr:MULTISPECIES: HIRAN domain-containing protein [unclassified Fusibacter]MCK8061339.1 HIRAN domain-containing protein [Fusibacter sp. A2]NPE23464.1 hypothetical protein [Fusibacter sp. A1]RXV59070.1 hypothetical protein DWB64_16735 [Fusibacter sp. A1]
MNRKQFNVQLRFIMRYAHKIYRESSLESFSESLQLSWAITRCQVYLKHTKVRGISYHQDVVRKLLGMNADDYRIDVVSETSNPYDPNAIAVVAKVKSEDNIKQLKLGYLSRAIATVASAAMDGAGALRILHSDVTGLNRPRSNLGLNLSYVVINEHT